MVLEGGLDGHWAGGCVEWLVSWWGCRFLDGGWGGDVIGWEGMMGCGMDWLGGFDILYY